MMIIEREGYHECIRGLLYVRMGSGAILICVDMLNKYLNRLSYLS